MKSAAACCSGVHVQTIDLLVHFDKCDVTVSANEQLGRTSHNLGVDVAVVPPWPTANVGDPYVDAFDCKSVVLRKDPAHDAAVYIAVNASHWMQLREFIGDLNLADISCMPNLVYIFQVGENTVI